MSTQAGVEFGTLALSPALLEVVSELGYKTLTPIQAQSLPVLLSGRDLVGQSQTGSGKTAAFALPILQNIEPSQRFITALVLCPTRELCAQVAREIRRLGRRHAGLQVLTLAGGEPLRPQAAALEKGVHIVVGTPGRVNDHLRRDTLSLASIKVLVLDEADRMLDMGFEEDMETILQAVPRRRQTVFFSATFPQSIATLSRRYQHDPVQVVVANDETGGAEIEQLGIQVELEQKPKALRAVLKRYPHEAAIVFANFKASVSELAAMLHETGVSVDALHGDLEQFDRDRVMAKFRNGSTRVLVATDVAARGIDVSTLDLVVNYDLPTQPEVYVHRIGRTGRAGKHGVAVSFITPREKLKVRGIEQLVGRALTRSDLGAIEVAPLEVQTLPEGEAKMETLRISGGRKQKIRPTDILGALTGEAGGLLGTDVGKIEIHDQYSYVAVSKHVSRAAYKSLSNGRIKGKKLLVALVK